MPRLVAIAVACALSLACSWRAGAETQSVDGLSLGQLQLVMPQGEPQGLVFLFSDEAGLSPELSRAASQLAELGLIVAPVSLRPFLDRQEAADRDCLYLVSDIEEASRRIQAVGGRGRYLTPIVAGTGMGAAVAYAAMAQAPDATLAGAASDGFTTRVTTKTPICAGAPVTPAAEGGFRYGPAPLPGWWRVAAAVVDTAAAQAFATEAGASDDAVVTPAAGADLGTRLTKLLEAPLAAAAADTLAGLPLVDLPVSEPGKLMAVIYSGDGGWRDIDKEIAGRLQAKGIPVVGVDSLRYFWSEKPPEQIAADLDLLLDHYREAWQRPDVVLVGYSFGADILPFAYNRLPEDTKAHIQRLALLSLSTNADLEIHVTGWMGVDGHSGSLPTAPELARLPPGLVQCFYGEEDTETACTRPELKGAELIKTPGGHHFDGKYDTLADAIAAPASGP
jgi:type IV secretory pathway VirJ component